MRVFWCTVRQFSPHGNGGWSRIGTYGGAIGRGFRGTVIASSAAGRVRAVAQKRRRS
jgi:hypothetical protein